MEHHSFFRTAKAFKQLVDYSIPTLTLLNFFYFEGFQICEIIPQLTKTKLMTII